MNVLVVILKVIAAIVVLILVVALFVKKDYGVEREVVINQPKEKVFTYIRSLKNQDNYSVWNQLDPGMAKSYSGEDGTPGFKYSWDSQKKEAGKGEQTIASIREGERIDMDLHFIKPFEGKANAYMTTSSVNPNQTKVAWGVKGRMSYPMNIMIPLMGMENKMGGDLSKSLEQLKKLLEP